MKWMRWTMYIKQRFEHFYFRATFALPYGSTQWVMCYRANSLKHITYMKQTDNNMNCNWQDNISEGNYSLLHYGFLQLKLSFSQFIRQREKIDVTGKIIIKRNNVCLHLVLIFCWVNSPLIALCQAMGRSRQVSMECSRVTWHKCVFNLLLYL